MCGCSSTKWIDRACVREGAFSPRDWVAHKVTVEDVPMVLRAAEDAKAAFMPYSCVGLRIVWQVEVDNVNRAPQWCVGYGLMGLTGPGSHLEAKGPMT